MPMTFDATLKDLARECPLGVLAEFDEPPDSPVTLLNVDVSAVTKAADLVLGRPARRDRPCRVSVERGRLEAR